MVALDSSNFDEMVIETDELWMVEFYAPWCGHCKALKPAWIAAASQLHGKVKLGAVNCEEENEVCEVSADVRPVNPLTRTMRTQGEGS